MQATVCATAPLKLSPKELKAEIFRHWHDLFNEVIEEDQAEGENEAVENKV